MVEDALKGPDVIIWVVNSSSKLPPRQRLNVEASLFVCCFEGDEVIRAFLITSTSICSRVYAVGFTLRCREMA